MLLTANWREWYHFRHQQECHHSGTAFENYITSVLERFHDDFINPNPTGSMGDGGCDGLAELGTIFYACYGQRPGRNAENELAGKIRSDFERGAEQWDCFHTWKFVTNAPVGPKSSRVLVELQQTHSPASNRPLSIHLVTSERFWTDVVSALDVPVLNELFPGAPGTENIELEDLIPLLDTLGTEGNTSEIGATVPVVPSGKMEFNSLSEASRIEFDAGRLLAPRIDRWYEESADPSLYDVHGQRFRKLYLEARAVTENPTEILERLYVSVAGTNFRMDGKRANAAFAVVSYFFDACHIFETPPLSGAGIDQESPDALTH